MAIASEPKRVTRNFNLAVFAFACAIGIVRFLLTSGTAATAHPAGLVISIALDAVRYVAGILVVAWIVREFWARLVCDVFKVRPIEYQEAIALVPVVSVLIS